MITKRAIQNQPSDAFDSVKTAFGRNISAETDAARRIQIRKRGGADFGFLGNIFVERRPQIITLSATE